MNFHSLLLLVSSALPDSVPGIKEEIAMAKDFSFDTLFDKLITTLVSFALSLTAAIVVFYIGRFLIKRIYRFIERIMTHRKVDTSLTTFVLSLTRILLYFILIVTVVGILGLETSSFIAIFASAGVALGMALSGTLQNFAGGVLILLLKPYKVGDYIEAQGFAGTVKEIQIFNTIINTGDNKSITIPNGGLSTGSINNYSREEYRRVDLDLSISYGDDIANARTQILAIIAENKLVVTEKEAADRAPAVFVKTLNTSSVDLSVRVWTRTTDYWSVYFGLNEQFYTLLPKRGVSFPFPQMDVHIVKD